MKKTVSVCMTAVMALSLLAGGAVQASALSAQAAKTAEPAAAVSEENCISGNWKRAADPALTDTVRKVFDKAFDGLEGVSYTPYALLASRTTASGRQYRILCKATVVLPGRAGGICGGHGEQELAGQGRDRGDRRCALPDRSGL